MKGSRLILIIAIALLTMSVACAPKSAPAPTPAPAPSPAPAPGLVVNIKLVAKDLAFDQKTISVPANAKVIINFDNQDSVPHNFALYETAEAKTSIFVGEIITGPKTIVYEFTAPVKAGTYFFHCDVHPNMKGDFIVIG